MTLSIFYPDFDLDRFRGNVWKDVGVEPLPQFSSRNEPDRRQRKRQRVNETIDDFLRLMASDNPPENEREMIAALTPVMTWLLSWLFRQLVIQVLKSCWKRWNS